jgi:hypothetical protein
MSKKSDKMLTDFMETSVLNPLYEAETSLTGEKVKVLKLVGTAVVCDKPGINGRSYPLKIMKREAERYTRKYIKNGRSFSELNHPRLNEKGEGKDYPVFEINLSKTCAIIEELSFKGDRMLIKLRVIEKHPAGASLKALVDAGLRPGVSLRGAGSTIKKSGFSEVADDYRLITIDVVGNPSFDDDAVMDSLYEGIQKGNVQILTEAVDMASREFINASEPKNNLFSGRKKLNKDALISLFESYSDEAKKEE